jgi:hypothetical protein
LVGTVLAGKGATLTRRFIMRGDDVVVLSTALMGVFLSVWFLVQTVEL